MNDGCWICHRTEDLSLVNGEWWCRRCLFDEFYDLDKGINYTLQHLDLFDKYPDGVEALWNWLNKGTPMISTRIEEFISENLEDFSEWVMSNPKIYPFEILMEKVKEM